MQRKLGCPDLGPAARPWQPFRVGAGPMTARGVHGDVEFLQCARWWLRAPVEWPGRSYGVADQTLFGYVAEQAWWLREFGGPLAIDFPGRFFDCIRHLEIRRQIAERRAVEDARAGAREAGHGD